FCNILSRQSNPSLPAHHEMSVGHVVTATSHSEEVPDGPTRRDGSEGSCIGTGVKLPQVVPGWRLCH
ncbi:hypothetical protein J6590_039468, partial [Homalodisca vitripennis]